MDQKEKLNRQEAEAPLATKNWGWKYHHLGIPTKEIKLGERFLAQFGMHISGFSKSPFGVEWIRGRCR